MNLKRFITKLTTALATLLVVAAFTTTANAQDDVAAGEKLFTENCTACHAFSKDGQGPALAGVHERRKEDWLLKWIKNAPKMIADGDPIAVQLFDKHGPTVMNTFEYLEDNDIKNIIAYIKSNPSDPGAPEPPKEDGKITTTTPESNEASASIKSLINFLIVAILIAVLLIIGSVFDVLGYISKYTGIPLSNPHKINGILMLVFLVVGMGAVIWEFAEHGKYVIIGDSASEHGVAVDSMLMTTLYLTGAVFIITQIALFVFGFLYRYDPKKKALYYPHNNTLEYIWTFIPAVALTVLVINGFTKWSAITAKAPENAETVEVFAYQFGWNVRYAGEDGKLGEKSFNLISGTNPLGLGVKSEYKKLLVEVKESLDKNEDLYKRMQTIPDPTAKENKEIARLAKQIRLQKAHMARLAAMENDERMFDNSSDDDLILKEIVLLKNKPINFVFRARDVIHSAYSPHFRMQMNCVPGMPTTFWFTPTKTTSEMRSILEDNKFDYYLYCAKICGNAHYNMKIKIRVVESETEYNTWMAEQKPAFMKNAEVVPAVEEAPAPKVESDSTEPEVVALLD
jgi:cytochrome c oxidase subunit 2